MKKFASIFLVVLSTTLLLCGCGKSVERENGNKNIQNDFVGASDEVGNGKIEEEASNRVVEPPVLSEGLRKGKVIGYVVSSVDKAEMPREIYFFNNGKVTVISGKKIGLTMGDFARMTDEEIWALLGPVKSACAENYVDGYMRNVVENEALDRVHQDLFGEKWIRVYYSTYDDIQYMYELIKNDAMPDEIDSDTIYRMYNLYLDYFCTDDFDDSYYDEYMAKEGPQYDKFVEGIKDLGERLQQKEAEIGYKGPFFDLPFSFVIYTDETGNNVKYENIVYPTREDACDSKYIAEYYELLELDVHRKSQKQIYESTYCCIGKVFSTACFLMREEMTLDTLESDNVLVDLSPEELNELFKDEVMARYE